MAIVVRGPFEGQPERNVRRYAHEERARLPCRGRRKRASPARAGLALAQLLRKILSRTLFLTVDDDRCVIT